MGVRPASGPWARRLTFAREMPAGSEDTCLVLAEGRVGGPRAPVGAGAGERQNGGSRWGLTHHESLSSGAGCLEIQVLLPPRWAWAERRGSVGWAEGVMTVSK